ncbi:MAG: hypothetical protein FWG07_02100 [Treponema sp.]|nr:hypothetical protein [Treponema sp.]
MYARKQGWVSIRINNPYAEEDTLEQELIEKFGLRHALVTNTHLKSDYEAWEMIGKNAEIRISYYLSNYKTIGIMSSKSIFHILDKTVLPHTGKTTFVSLVGGMGAAGAQWHANYMSQRFAEKTGGKAFLLNAPSFVQNKEMQKSLTQEEDIQHAHKYFKECDVIFTGICQIDTKATLVESGTLAKDDLIHLKTSGAVAAVAGTFFDKNGDLLKTELSQRFIGIGYDEIKACSNVVGIALGNEKIAAIEAALRSTLFHELITDSETAKTLLDSWQKKGKSF